ncbi:RNA polymerase sigma factor [Oscillibacter sp.]|uniref:RNA polymerase sigma factor n=1 Tax=Oscillibacter sp. TaxID=1945593 RepID=UPI00260D642E|nr:RNA polymerase sigma factor [Oscillibacter sp.]MDD3346713.1 RNA polymerase sigma factor [Oscillibacter sp.]
MAETADLFEQLYRTYGPALYRFCLLQMKNPADAEDVMQEVFCKRLYRAPAFASPEHERRWLFRVALNQCRDAWKRASRSELPLETAVGAAVTPAELNLLEQVANLPEAQRTALHLHYYEGYSVREIAALLGVTVSTVKMRMKRGREALRNGWEEEA